MSTNAPTSSRFTLDSGIELAWYDWGGEGPLVLLHHASGLCGRIWDMVAADLRTDHRVVALDARGHGDSSKPDPAQRWDTFAQDLQDFSVQLCAALGRKRINLGVGHSMGGAAMVLCAARAPQRFAQLLLFDPVLATQEMAQAFAARQGGAKRISLTTRMRQCTFATREEAHALWQGQALYEDWQAQMLQDFVTHGLREREDGQLELKCAPSFEGAIYALGATQSAFGPDVIAVPTHILSATDSRFGPGHQHLAKLAAGSVRITADPDGHMMPMKRPERVVQLIRDATES